MLYGRCTRTVLVLHGYRTCLVARHCERPCVSMIHIASRGPTQKRTNICWRFPLDVSLQIRSLVGSGCVVLALYSECARTILVLYLLGVSAYSDAGHACQIAPRRPMQRRTSICRRLPSQLSMQTSSQFGLAAARLRGRPTRRRRHRLPWRGHGRTFPYEQDAAPQRSCSTSRTHSRPYAALGCWRCFARCTFLYAKAKRMLHIKLPVEDDVWGGGVGRVGWEPGMPIWHGWRRLGGTLENTGFVASKICRRALEAGAWIWLGDSCGRSVAQRLAVKLGEGALDVDAVARSEGAE